MSFFTANILIHICSEWIDLVFILYATFCPVNHASKNDTLKVNNKNKMLFIIKISLERSFYSHLLILKTREKLTTTKKQLKTCTNKIIRFPLCICLVELSNQVTSKTKNYLGIVMGVSQAMYDWMAILDTNLLIRKKQGIKCIYKWNVLFEGKIFKTWKFLNFFCFKTSRNKKKLKRFCKAIALITYTGYAYAVYVDTEYPRVVQNYLLFSFSSTHK